MDDSSPKASLKTRLIYSLVFLLLWTITVGYYYPQFTQAQRWMLAVAFIFVIWLHYFTGQRLWRAGKALPVWPLLLATLGFSTLRWIYAFSLLQHHLPSNTIFHTPNSALWFIIPSSLILILLGYGSAQYRYYRKKEDAELSPTKDIAHAPIMPLQLNFRASGKDVLLPIGELLYVSAKGEYVIYHCIDRQYVRYQRMKEAEVELNSYGFIRIHRSHIVNRKAVRTFSNNQVELNDGISLPVSKSYRGQLVAIKGE